jgi:uncharacterized protein DUF6510
MSRHERWLDGNALGGLLHELFGAELTPARRTCQSCGAERALAEHRLYRGAGAVLRCPVCEQIALVTTTLRDRHVVQLNGAWRVELPRR